MSDWLSPYLSVVLPELVVILVDTVQCVAAHKNVMGEVTRTGIELLRHPRDVARWSKPRVTMSIT